MNCCKLTDCYRNFGEVTRRKLPSLLCHPAFSILTACETVHSSEPETGSDGRGAAVPCFSSSLSIHLHSSARVPSSTNMHCSPKVLRRGCVAQNKEDLKQELKHLKTWNKRREGGRREKKKSSGINPSVALAAQSPWQVPAVSKEL